MRKAMLGLFGFTPSPVSRKSKYVLLTEASITIIGHQSGSTCLIPSCIPLDPSKNAQLLGHIQLFMVIYPYGLSCLVSIKMSILTKLAWSPDSTFHEFTIVAITRNIDQVTCLGALIKSPLSDNILFFNFGLTTKIKKQNAEQTDNKSHAPFILHLIILPYLLLTS